MSKQFNTEFRKKKASYSQVVFNCSVAYNNDIPPQQTFLSKLAKIWLKDVRTRNIENQNI